LVRLTLFTVIPVADRERVLQILASLMDLAQGKEGCLEDNLELGDERADSYALVINWSDLSSLHNYLKEPPIRRLLSEIERLQGSPRIVIQHPDGSVESLANGSLLCTTEEISDQRTTVTPGKSRKTTAL